MKKENPAETTRRLLRAEAERKLVAARGLLKTKDADGVLEMMIKRARVVLEPNAHPDESLDDLPAFIERMKELNVPADDDTLKVVNALDTEMARCGLPRRANAATASLEQAIREAEAHLLTLKAK
jgi:hypothetical protein